jgi:hypothetical protein
LVSEYLTGIENESRDHKHGCAGPHLRKRFAMTRQLGTRSDSLTTMTLNYGAATA